MISRILEGTIAHHRYGPVVHDLSYPVYMYAFDLSELPVLDRRYPLFGYNRGGVTSIRDKDYLEPGDLPIGRKIGRLLARHRIDDPVDSVLLITSARYFNHGFNPVSFHYCFSPDQKLVAVIAEVNNTFGERHSYVLTENTAETEEWFATFQTPKVFHVSPFNKVEGTYSFFFSEPGDRLEIRIELHNDGQPILAAVLKAKSRPLTVANHLKTMLKYPGTPHLSIPRIYTHAFKLFFRKQLTYNEKPVPRDPMTQKKRKPGRIENGCMRLAVIALRKITTGCLEMELPDQTRRFFGNPNHGQRAVIRVNDYLFFPRVIFQGDIGFGEAYMESLWDTEDLVGLLLLLIQNRDRFSDGNLMLSFLFRLKEKTAHDKRRNTVRNTPENIRAHYDLSNEFYTLFLDRRMMYSCALFQTPADSLETAQENKMVRILAQADVREGHHILEIGCGWGGFAVFAAKKTGCRVTGITVSRAQYDMACQRVKAQGLADRVSIRLLDYRNVMGSFDRIVSIEMIEAVGREFFSAYFKKSWDLLKPGGRMVFQSIIIEDLRYDRYCRERDWIQKHIFPGGHLPCLKILKETIAAHTDFDLADVFHMGPHYAATLCLWQRRLLAHQEKIGTMGFDERFIRKWRYYFSLCEAGFSVGGIDDIQVTLTRSPRH